MNKDIYQCLLKECEEEAQIIIDTAMQRVSDLGYGVVADGTVDGNGIWFNSLRVVPTRVVPTKMQGKSSGCAGVAQDPKSASDAANCDSEVKS